MRTVPNLLWLEGAAIGEAIPDLRRMCFAFSPGYLNVVARKRRGRAGVVVIEAAGLRSFVPIVLWRRVFLKLCTILAPPTTASGGTLPPIHEGQVLEALVQFLRCGGLAHRVTQPANWAVFQTAPAGAAFTPFGTYRLSLNEGEASVWRGLHQKHRNVIRRALEQGVEVKFGVEHLAPFYALYHSTMLRNGLAPESVEFLRALMEGNGFQVACGVAYVGGESVAGLFAPYNDYAAYYLFGGTAERVAINGANNLLHYEAIKRFIRHGCDHYDLVGARLGPDVSERLIGIQRFKERFGADLKKGVLWKLDLSPWRCAAFDALVSLRAHARGIPSARDIIDQQRTASARGIS
jgi:hypothetical protein